MRQERTELLTLPPAKRRLVVLGDPHGDPIGLEEVLAREAGPVAADETAIVSVGDNVGYVDGVISSQLCALLAERGIPSVLGNHEAWISEGRLFLSPPGEPATLTPEALAWCRALPYRIRVQMAARPDLALSVVHTLPDWAYVTADNAERLADLEEAQVTFCGHTHHPAIYVLRRGRRPDVRPFDPGRAQPLEVRLEPEARYVVDAGSLGRPSRPGGGARIERGTYAVLDVNAGTIALRSIDKRPRLRALFRQMADQGPRSRRARAGPAAGEAGEAESQGGGEVEA